ncbi:MAG: hypothetical protein WCO96_01030 [Actinomycetes bacterium]
MRGRCGQAGVEYAGVTALVAIALCSAAALTTGGLGDSVERSIARGVCFVAGQRCPALAAAAMPPDLEACPLERRDRLGDLSLDIGVARLAGRLGLAVERASDGSVRVSFADEGRVGLGAAVGAHVESGRIAGRAEASVDGGVAVTAGRVWVLRDRAAAERFVARFGESQRFSGRLKRDLGLLCPVCAAIAGSPDPPPQPDEHWYAGGLQIGSSLAVSAGPASAGLESLLRGAVGRRVARNGTTWFLRFDDQILGSLDLLAHGVDSQIEKHSLVSLDLDRAGRPVRLKVTVQRRVSTRRVNRLPRSLRAILGSSAGGAGRVVESETSLDLRDPRSRRTATALLAGVKGADPRSSSDALRGVRSQLRERGIGTVRIWSLDRSGSRLGVGAGLGARLGIDAQSRAESQRLLAVASRLPGLDWLTRADCLAT